MTVSAQNMQIITLIDPISGTAVASATADCRDCDYATVVINLASEVNTNATGPALSLGSSDDLTTYATVTADRAAEDITAAKKVVYHVDMRTQKPYLKLTVTPATTTNDVVVVSANVVKSRLKEGPASTSDMVDSGDVVVTA